MFFISPIKGYAITYTGSSVEPFSYVLSSSNGTSTDITEGTYTYIGSGVIELKLIAHNLSTSSKTIFANGDYSVYIDTTEGTYLLKSGNISGSAISVNGSGTAVITQTISFNNFYLPGAFRSYYITGNVFTYEYNGSTDTYCSFSSASVTGFSHSESHYNTGDYTTILNNIYNELLSQGLTLDNLYTELLNQGISLDILVKSMCFDFPTEIDGNYRLSSVYTNASLDLNNSYINIGYGAFDFSTFSNFSCSFKIPASCKMRFYSIRYNNAFVGCTFNSQAVDSYHEYYLNDIYVYEVTFKSAYVNQFSSVSFWPLNSVTHGRFALYDYVYSASDILDYMNTILNTGSSINLIKKRIHFNISTRPLFIHII